MLVSIEKLWHDAFITKGGHWCPGLQEKYYEKETILQS